MEYLIIVLATLVILLSVAVIVAVREANATIRHIQRELDPERPESGDR